jgi:translation initiation factor 1 (eIF-1/SUI1)
MKSSYQQRISENNELRRKNKELMEELDKMRNAVAILNNSILRMDLNTRVNDLDLQLKYKELCKEMEEQVCCGGCGKLVMSNEITTYAEAPYTKLCKECWT